MATAAGVCLQRAGALTAAEAAAAETHAARPAKGSVGRGAPAASGGTQPVAPGARAGGGGGAGRGGAQTAAAAAGAGGAQLAAAAGGRKKKDRDRDAAKADKAPLVTSETVYKRLMWHPAVDPDAVEVGYLDRFKGLLWMPLRLWRPDGMDDLDAVPFHRVVFFRANGHVVWDRHERRERLAELFAGDLAPAAGAAAAAEPVAKPPRNLGRGRMYPRTDLLDLRQWGGARWERIAAGSTAAVPLGRPFRLAQWNMLNRRFHDDVGESARRWPALLHELERADADVVCLQEVDSAAADAVAAADWVRDGYVATEFTRGSWAGADGPGVIVLLRRDPPVCPCLSARVLHFTPHVRAVLLTLSVEGREVGIANVHLTSDHAPDARGKRAKQLEALFGVTRALEHSMLCGDFNFGDGAENAAVDWGRHRDAWGAVQQGDPGDTWDPQRNPLAALGSRTGEVRRLDRLMLRGGLRPLHGALLGTNPHAWTPVEGCAESCRGADGDVDTVPAAAAAGGVQALLRPAPAGQLRIVLRGATGAGKSALAAALHALFGGMLVALPPAAPGASFRTALVRAAGSAAPAVVVDAPHLSAASLDGTLGALAEGGLLGTAPTVLVVELRGIRPRPAAAAAGAGGCRGEAAAAAIASADAGCDIGAVVAAIAAAGIEPSQAAARAAATLPLAAASPLQEQLAAVIAAARQAGALGGDPAAHADAVARATACAPRLSAGGRLRLPLLPPSDHFGLLWTVTLQADRGEEEVGHAATVYRGPALPTERSALAVLPPDGLCGPIHAMRAAVDKAAARWPPHINVLWPFIPPGALDEGSRALVAEAMAMVPPFRVRLRVLRSFNDYTRGRAVLWLDPEEPDGGGALSALHSQLLRRFPAPASGLREYNPHMTVGRGRPQDVSSIAERFGWSAEGAQGVHEVSWTVDRVVLLARPDDESPMRPVEEFMLGRGAAPAAQGELREPDPPTRETPPEILEPHPLGGGRRLPPYCPGDVLERWLLSSCVDSLAEELGDGQRALTLCADAPTHISQRGARYHLPGCLLGSFLRWWQRARESRERFYLEEVRGSLFRPYVDVDAKLLPGAPPVDLDSTAWLALLCESARTGFGLSGPVWLVVCECHGDWEDQSCPEAGAKSGFRVFFQAVYCDAGHYADWVRALSSHFAATAADYPGRPAGFPLHEVVDDKSAFWDRGRLIGSVKRRRELDRVYKLRAAYCQQGAGAPVARAAGLTEHLRQHPLELLYATSLRYWDELPPFARPVDGPQQTPWYVACCGAAGDLCLVDALTLQVSHPPPGAAHADWLRQRGVDARASAVVAAQPSPPPAVAAALRLPRLAPAALGAAAPATASATELAGRVTAALRRRRQEAEGGTPAVRLAVWRRILACAPRAKAG